VTTRLFLSVTPEPFSSISTLPPFCFSGYRGYG
jgi:hypothetical protein